MIGDNVIENIIGSLFVTGVTLFLLWGEYD